MAAVPEEETMSIRNFVLKRTHIGCTTLQEGVKVDCYGRQTKLLAKHVPSSAAPTFLQTEGHVHQILRAKPHAALLSPVDLIEEQNDTYVIFPAVGQNLHSHIRSNSRLKEAEARGIFKQLVSAVAHCHNNRIILRDMKLGKVFFHAEDSSRVVLADLESALYVPLENPLLNDQKGSPAYVSPEVLTCQPYCGAAADVWVLGVMLYVILTGSYPFQDTRPAKLFQKIQKAAAAVFFPPFVSESARTLICRLLNRDPQRRPHAADVLMDPWLLEEPFVLPTPHVPEDNVPDVTDQAVPDLCSPPASAVRRKRRSRPPPLTITLDDSGDRTMQEDRPLLSPGIENTHLADYSPPTSRKRTNSEALDVNKAATRRRVSPTLPSPTVGVPC